MNGANDFYVEQLKAKEAYKKFIYRRRVGLLLKDKNGIDKTILNETFGIIGDYKLTSQLAVSGKIE